MYVTADILAHSQDLGVWAYFAELKEIGPDALINICRCMRMKEEHTFSIRKGSFV